MPYDPNRHHRRSIRLPGYDYTQPGFYFVTIVTHGRRCLFDNPTLRAIAEQQWQALACIDRVALDAWVVMPNHMHGIIVIASPVGVKPIVAAPRGLGINVAAGSLGAIVRSYKSSVTKRINRKGHTLGGLIWQRGYWERIVRDQRQLEAIRRYIDHNPARWEADRDNLNALLARMQSRR